MGLLRVLLALSVLLDHAHGLGGYAMVGGPLAVQCFFIISGFYMGMVLTERYDRPALNRAFYANRFLRIYGVYFLFLVLHLAIFAAVAAGGGGSPLSPYFEASIPWYEKALLGLLNVTLIGQDLPLWLTIEQGHLAWTSSFVASGDGAVFRFMVIPAAWSLSLELCFYAIAPFIVRRPAWQIATLLGASLAARAVAAMAGLTGDPFNARFFPFELALFLAGVLSYRLWTARPEWFQGTPARLLALAVPAAILGWPWLVGSWSADLFFTPPRLLLLTVVALGLPAIHAWRGRSASDRAIGDLSYPFYLGHLLVLGMVASLSADPFVRVVLAALLTLALSWLVVRTVDAPIEAFRRRLAQRAGVRA